MIRPALLPVSLLLAGIALAVRAPAPAAAAEDPPVLLRCEVRDPARRLQESSRVLADHLRDGYAAKYPSAVVLAGSTAEIAASLEAQLEALGPAHRALGEAWAAFDEAVRRSPLPRDPPVGRILPSYAQGVAELEGQIGCSPPAEGPAMVPCPSILTAHLLAEVGTEMHDYLSQRHAEQSEQIEAAGALAGAARSLHQVLHDLEIAVPGAQRTFDALEAALAGSALTDTNQPEDVEVKTRLAAVRDAVAALDPAVGSCHQPAESHAGH